MSIPIAQDETGPVGASPKGPGETQPSRSVPTGPLGTLGVLREEETGKANGDGVSFSWSPVCPEKVCSLKTGCPTPVSV